MSETIAAEPFDADPAWDQAQAEPAAMNVPFWRASLVVMVGVVATSLAQDKVLGRIPVRNLLKNGLHLDRSGTATFLFAIGFAWYLKPLFGAVIDAFPLFGSRRRSYLLIGSVLAAAGWVATGFAANSYSALFVTMMLTCCAMVVVSCATGGLLVETAQATASAGRLAGLRQTTNALCYLISAPLSGFLASIAFGWTALSCALVAASMVPVTLFLLRERHQPAQPFSALWGQLRAIAAARPMWSAAAIMLVFYIAPGEETALFYRQQNDLHMTTQMQGWLVFAMYGTGIVTALCYTRFSRRVSQGGLLMLGIGATVFTQLLFLFYNSVPAALMIEATNGIGFGLAEVAFLDLSARATPRGSESLGYALMVSVRNLALFGTDIIGAHLMDDYGWSFSALVLVNAATSALALPLILLLPRTLLLQREG
jgi:predicted MFS family arabinose efflux permease